ncbi:MAG: hypothetical protein PF505_13010 [Vallitaleaceae bacterium]|jgi:sugar-specific transcriptional regulator TrmB|nr:hypothetical protein [Vallitaleaceae bacterium]
MDLLQSLKNVGFTQQEATIYMVLCKTGMLTGYEAAKLSGISRSNAYAALSSLVDKGYAYLVEGASAKYMPITKDELITNATRIFDETIRTIVRELTFNDLPNEPYITIIGEKPILEKLINMIESAAKRIYLSCNNSILDAIKPILNAAQTRGLKVVILVPSDLPADLPSDLPTDLPSDLVLGLNHAHYNAEPQASYKIIIDTSEVLAGTLSHSLYSKNVTLVNLIRESFINEIAVLEQQNNGGNNAKKI